MIRLWRLVRFSGLLVWYAARMSGVSRRLPPGERASRVADLQTQGGKSICKSLGVTVDITFLPDSSKPLLYVCNHLGLFDPWVLASRLKVSFAAKIEMDKWPIFGWVGKSTGLLYVDRKRRLKTGGFVDEVRQRMHEGVGVLVFPEGTTNAEDALLPFQTGGFAAVAGMPDGIVQPIFMWAREIGGIPTSPTTRREIAWPQGVSMWRNAWIVLGHRSIAFEILGGESISTAGKGRKELASLAQDQVEALMRSTDM